MNQLVIGELTKKHCCKLVKPFSLSLLGQKVVKLQPKALFTSYTMLLSVPDA